MKILITGHTSGVGAATLKILKNMGYSVIGISRSNGYDIRDTENIFKKIMAEDPDVFINNAYLKDSQTTILKRVYEKWKLKEKLIVNICSVASLIPESHEDYLMDYAKDKRSQRDFCHDINFNYSKKDFSKVKCKLTNLNFDYTKTNFKSKHDKRKFPNLLPDDVGNLIAFIISNQNICFREVSFHSTRPPEIMI